MKFGTKLLGRLGAAMIITAVASTACANVWLDESFEGTPFVQATAWSSAGMTAGVQATTPAGATLDPKANDAVSPLLSASPLVQTGGVTMSKSFNGTKSYQLNPGQVLSIGPTYENTGNGPIQVFQFAVAVDPIPAAGTVGELRFNWDANGAGAGLAYSFFVRFVSTGTSVDILGGEDLLNSPAISQTIGTIPDANTWRYVTLIYQKNTGTVSDSRAPFTGLVLATGMHYFVSSTTEALYVVANVGDVGSVGQGWGFTVSSGALFLDDMYWDGGVDGAPPWVAPTSPRALNKTPVAGVADWTLF